MQTQGRSRRRNSDSRCEVLPDEQVGKVFGPASPLARQWITALLAHFDRLSSDVRARLFDQWIAAQSLTFVLARPRSLVGLASLNRAIGLSPVNDLRPILLATQCYYGAVIEAFVGQLCPAGSTDVSDDALSQLAVGLGAMGPALAEQWRWLGLKHSAPALPSCDLFRPLYERLFPRPLRHAMGEYYTPGWLVALVLDSVVYTGDTNAKLLDPTCGSGAFLVQAIHRYRQRMPGHGGLAELLRNVVGFDLNPLAVRTARANYLWAIGDLLADHAKIEVPVLRRDMVTEPAGESAGAFDFVVGNPPWVAWDNLTPAYREQTKPLWTGYGLFSLSAREARHGGGKKDLSALITYIAADRYLRRDGRLGMVLPQTLLQSRGAGEGFRRFKIGQSGDELGVVEVHDLTAVSPFDAANWVCTVALRKGVATHFPVPYTRWLRGESREPAEPLRQVLDAWPQEPARAGSPWILLPRGLTPQRIERPKAGEYAAHLGANTGGANGVYWFEVIEPGPKVTQVRNLHGVGKIAVEPFAGLIETELLYPLIRWGQVSRFRAMSDRVVLLVQDTATRRGLDEAVLTEKFPLAWSYLQRYRQQLIDRAAYRRYQSRGPFYSMYDVGQYTVAEHKVIWRRMDRRMTAAAVGPLSVGGLSARPAVPQETCVLVSVGDATEAHYLAALLNSQIVDFLVRSRSVLGGKGFGSPGVMDLLALDRFVPDNRLHRRLAELGRAATASPESGAEAQAEMDAVAAELLGYSASDRQAMREFMPAR